VSVSSTAPSTNYIGTAWNDGTNTDRYVGSFLTDASSHIIRFYRVANAVYWEANIGAAPFILLSAGGSATAANVACTGVLPATARIIKLMVKFIGAPTGSAIGNANLVPASSVGFFVSGLGGSLSQGNPDIPVVWAAGAANIQYICGTGTTLDINAVGYVEDR
jgi:hypothetical protein